MLIEVEENVIFPVVKIDNFMRSYAFANEINRKK